MSSGSKGSARGALVAVFVGMLGWLVATPARAESGRYNLHFTAMGPLPAGGEAAFDWQLARPFALEIAAGGGLLTDFAQTYDGVFYATFGARLRLADDESGYLDEGGSIAGHYWIATHAGFFVTGATVGLLVDVSTGYDFSIVAPVSIGPFLRGGVGVADTIAPFIAGGIQVTIEIDPLREPRVDSDGDGVFDGRDRCPTTRGGQVVNGAGCGDSDGDGVYDDADACPDTPPDSNVDARGCIVLPPALVLDGIVFEYDSAVIQPQSEPVLMRAAQALRDNPDARVEIGGHTDDIGSASYNEELSRQRAEAVREWLAQHGIERARLEVRGYGSSQPRVPNTDEASRQQNRRIEFRHIDRGEPRR